MHFIIKFVIKFITDADEYFDYEDLTRTILPFWQQVRRYDKI